MKTSVEIRKEIFRLHDLQQFEAIALDLFQHQYTYNPVFHQFANLNHRQPQYVNSLEALPFLPVTMFKTHRVFTGDDPGNGGLTFYSSGTTGQHRAMHLIPEPEIYRQSFLLGFERVFGAPSQYHIFALLPSYLQRGNSSLVYMVDHLITLAGGNKGGFYINDHQHLLANLTDALSDSTKKTMLIGVTFALLEFMQHLPHPLPALTLVETGGMKGHGKEMIREELYRYLQNGYGLKRIASEYGMTELCSQAWSLDQGIYHTPPWMKVFTRDLNDPMRILPPGKRGAINVIDFANMNTCAFLATDDIGLVHPDGSFEVLGRIDGSETRGCNLMIL